MFRTFGKIIFLTVLVVAGSVGVWQYYDHTSASRQIAKLEQEKIQLQQIVERLGTERRVAEILVTDQKIVDGVPHTTLLLVEYTKDGASLPPKQFTIEGKEAHVDAMVIQFDRGLVEQGDALRGHSLALFHKIYGDHQSPEHGLPIDEPGKIPDVYRGSDPRVTEFEQGLWKDFWRLADDKAYRESKGVRLAMGQGIWFPCERDKLYTISTQSDGGVIYQSEPLKGIYREALKQRDAM